MTLLDDPRVEVATTDDPKVETPQAPPPEHLMHVLNHKGDSRVTWDRNNPVEVEVARQAFDTFRRKGYAMARVEQPGGAEIIREFDPAAERIVAYPALQGG